MALTVTYVLVTAVLVAFVSILIARRRTDEINSRLRGLIEFTRGMVKSKPQESGKYAGDGFHDLERSLRTVANDVQEVVDRLEIEAARREAILSSMSEGVLAVDSDLRVIFSNDAILRAVGVRRPIRDRLPLLELVRDSEVLAMLADVISSGKQSKRSLEVGVANGHTFEIYAAPLDTGSGRGAIAIFHDITDLERLEQVRKDFVANVSHEMRTPLASIIAYSDTLLEGALEEPAVNQRFIEVIRSNAVRLTSIATDLLTLSDLESGASPGQPERIAVHEVLESVLKTVEPEARANGINIVRINIEERYILGHRGRLEQALLNLLANAVKFNRPGGEVHVAVFETENDRVQIEVADTGIGIPSQDLPRIFERFYRVDKARSRAVGGTGLGLSIVKHVVEGMDGTINVESQLGRGSRFTVRIPAATDAT